MPLIGWNDRLNVGVEVIDRDHQWLLRMLNELYDGLRAGLGH